MTAPATATEAQTQPMEMSLREGKSRLGWYWVVFLVAQVLAIVLCLYVAGTHWYMKNAYNYGLRVVGYSSWMGRQDCKIVLYGDSSALTGLSPGVVEQKTGMKACNVAEGTVVLEVTGSDAPLREYLKHNAAPRFIVGMWTPSMFHPDQPAWQKYHSEGLVYGLNYLSRRETLMGLARHPEWALRLFNDMIESLISAIDDRLLGIRQVDVRAERIAHGGQWMFPLPPETRCVRGKMDPGTVGRWQNSVEAFRRKYSNPQTTVIVNISPVPVCDVSYGLYAQREAGLYDNVFERLPLRYFNQGDVHFSAEGSRYISDRVADQVLHALRQQGSGAETAANR